LFDPLYRSDFGPGPLDAPDPNWLDGARIRDGIPRDGPNFVDGVRLWGGLLFIVPPDIFFLLGPFLLI
jgi:hypothetical protein